MRLQEDATCDLCGRFGAYEFGECKLCDTCYEGSGSCCAQFGKEEETKESEER